MPFTAVLSPSSTTTLGKQFVIEMYECDSECFDDLKWVESVLLEAAHRARATVINSVFHKFNPIGISGVVVIAESHLAIHTWPEHRYAAIDVFTCGEVLESSAAINYMAQQFQSRRYTVTEITRGVVGMPRLVSRGTGDTPIPSVQRMSRKKHGT